MCVGEGGAHGGKTIDVRSPGLRVSTQVTDPVVKVVDCNEEHIRTSSAVSVRVEKKTVIRVRKRRVIMDYIGYQRIVLLSVLLNRIIFER